MQLLTVQDVMERVGKRLQLRWLTHSEGRSDPIQGDFPGASGQALVGPLNCIHPNRVQVIGHAELVYLADLSPNAHCETIDKLFNGRPAASSATMATPPICFPLLISFTCSSRLPCLSTKRQRGCKVPRKTGFSSGRYTPWLGACLGCTPAHAA